MRALLLVLALLVGCVQRGSPEPMPRQAEAVAIVWYQTYEATVEPPVIEWIDDVCDGRPGFVDRGDCVSGLHFDPPVDLIVLQRPVGWRKLSDVALVHELLHAALVYSEGSSDKHHTKYPEKWNGAQSRDNVVIPLEKQSVHNRARAALVEVGL